MNNFSKHKPKGNMKKYTLTLSALMVFLFAQTVFGQVFGTNCPTLEEQQAAYNRSLASKVIVTNTASQQLQCHYNQLATYFQQLHTSKQQAAKDLQQKNKDIQQASKDTQQLETDAILAEKIASLNIANSHYDELVAFIEVLIPLLGSCDPALKADLTRVHTNRSGHADGTSPGGQTSNLNGFLNPGYLIITK